MLALAVDFGSVAAVDFDASALVLACLAAASFVVVCEVVVVVWFSTASTLVGKKVKLNTQTVAMVRIEYLLKTIVISFQGLGRVYVINDRLGLSIAQRVF